MKFTDDDKEKITNISRAVRKEKFGRFMTTFIHMIKEEDLDYNESVMLLEEIRTLIDNAHVRSLERAELHRRQEFDSAYR